LIRRLGAFLKRLKKLTPRLPHITKLMALAIRLEHLLATGQVKDQAEIARTAGITRACQFAPETVPAIGAPNGTSW